jgi:hypothetical protein
MTEPSAWLTVPDFAEALGLTPTQVRELIREGALASTRRGERATVQIPAGFIVESEHGPEIVPTLRGTLTMLRDAGLDDDEILEWLLETNDELGKAPLTALREGQRAPVRRAAQTLF